MKICFVQPAQGWFNDNLDPPFNLMYLAAVAEQEQWQAQIVDMKTPDEPLPYADVYGVTATSSEWTAAVILSHRLRKEHPESRLWVGGPHISAMPEAVWGSAFDVAVTGEGERTLQALLDGSFEKHLTSADRYTWAKDREGVPIDSIPFPARHLIDWKQYKRGIFWKDELLAPAVGIITSRGCPGNCIFCGSHIIFGHKCRFRSIENVVTEMKLVIETMGYHGFNFYDDTFCLSHPRVVDLCRAFRPLNVVWRCLSRTNTVDLELLKTMRWAGCKEIIYGIESYHQTVLNNLQKGATVEQNLKAVEMTKRVGIQVKAGMIVGSPGETWETIRETERLLKKCPPDYWVVSVFTPHPGSAAWETPEKFGLKILTRDIAEYAMTGPDMKGNVVVETEQMTKTDIEQARDEMIELLTDISPLGNSLLWKKQ